MQNTKTGTVLNRAGTMFSRTLERTSKEFFRGFHPIVFRARLSDIFDFIFVFHSNLAFHSVRFTKLFGEIYGAFTGTASGRGLAPRRYVVLQLRTIASIPSALPVTEVLYFKFASRRVVANDYKFKGESRQVLSTGEIMPRFFVGT